MIKAYTDYICNNVDKINIHKDATISCSFDGDADRIVFYDNDNNNAVLLDGDYILALILLFITNILIKNKKITVFIYDTMYLVLV